MFEKKETGNRQRKESVIKLNPNESNLWRLNHDMLLLSLVKGLLCMSAGQFFITFN